MKSSRQLPCSDGSFEQVVAMDGPAASGKSTAARLLAEHFGIPCVNTGAMYRAVTLAFLRAGVTPADRQAVEKILQALSFEYRRDENGEFILFMNGENPGAALRSPEVGAHVSEVAALPEVRAKLTELQRELARGQWLVMEGRDIGSVVFPRAKYKFFVTASPMVRAERRLAQSGENVSGATLREVAAAIAKRDEIDSTRAVAPLRKMPDAVLIDSSNLSVLEVLERMMEAMGNHECA